MLFGRRNAPSWGERIRILLWPRRSWQRSLRYIGLRLVRLPGTSHQLALGCAIGVFAAITPLVGVQMLLAGVAALALKASFAAAMIGTLFGNPAVWALIWPATYTTGAVFLQSPTSLGDVALKTELVKFAEALWQFSPDVTSAAFNVVWPILAPMLVGTIPIGLLLAAVFYYLCRRAADAYRARRLSNRLGNSGFPLGFFIASYDPLHG